MSKYNVKPTQTTAGWSTKIDWPSNLKGTSGTEIINSSEVTFTYNSTTGEVTASVDLSQKASS